MQLQLKPDLYPVFEDPSCEVVERRADECYGYSYSRTGLETLISPVGLGRVAPSSTVGSQGFSQVSCIISRFPLIQTQWDLDTSELDSDHPSPIFLTPPVSFTPHFPYSQKAC